MLLIAVRASHCFVVFDTNAQFARNFVTRG